jgi:hypothetical protein
MKKIAAIAVLAMCQFPMALQAPYLYSADSISDSTVHLTWRNNSTDYLGIIIMRKSETSTQFSVVDTATGSAALYDDNTVLPSAVPYVYALTAYSQTEHADTSNNDTVRITPKITDSFAAPFMLSANWDSLTHSVTIQFYDSSTLETGFRIYRSKNFSSFNMIKDTVSPVPSQKGTFTYKDSAVSSNFWYQYYAVAYKAQQALGSDTDTVFTFIMGDYIKSTSRKCMLVRKTAVFPIKYKGWSLKSGDTIAFNETGTPDPTMFSIINISDPSQPKYMGFGTSEAARMLKPSISKNDFLFCTNNQILYCFRYDKGTLISVNQINYLGYIESFPGFVSNGHVVVSYYISTPFGDSGECIEYSFTSNQFSLESSSMFPQFNFFGNSSQHSILERTEYDGKYLAIARSSYSYGAPGHLTYYADTMEQIIDFNFPSLPHAILFYNPTRGLPRFVDNILVDTPEIKAANDIYIDTVKNIVCALSDTLLSIYSCETRVGVPNPVSSVPVRGRTLQIIPLTGINTACIMLPAHARPATVSIYGISGRQLRRFENVAGNAVFWSHACLAGTFIVNAVVDGCPFTAKIILVR